MWMSRESKFEEGIAIRGGVPVCFPWFGAAPEGKSGSHGFVRNSMWEFSDAGVSSDGGNFVTLSYKCDDFALHYTVVAAKELTLSLKITNLSDKELNFSGALHTYFNISDCSNIEVKDLDSLSFLDSVSGESGIQYGSLSIDREIDRAFRSCGSVRLTDHGFKRTILIDKYGSDSTVIWNPWIAKSQRMADFGNDEYHTMICIEAAKVPAIGDTGVIAAGDSYELRQVIRVRNEA